MCMSLDCEGKSGVSRERAQAGTCRTCCKLNPKRHYRTNRPGIYSRYTRNSDYAIRVIGSEPYCLCALQRWGNLPWPWPVAADWSVRNEPCHSWCGKHKKKDKLHQSENKAHSSSPVHHALFWMIARCRRTLGGTLWFKVENSSHSSILLNQCSWKHLSNLWNNWKAITCWPARRLVGFKFMGQTV